MSSETQKDLQTSMKQLLDIDSTEVDGMDEEQLTRLLQKVEDVASDLDSRLDQVRFDYDIFMTFLKQ
jgi:hypothetical protein